MSCEKCHEYVMRQCIIERENINLSNNKKSFMTHADAIEYQDKNRDR